MRAMRNLRERRLLGNDLSLLLVEGYLWERQLQERQLQEKQLQERPTQNRSGEDCKGPTMAVVAERVIHDWGW